MTREKRKCGDYSEELVAAVKYLMGKGITRSTEIARRLGISPFTVRNIKYRLQKQKEEKSEEGKLSVTRPRSKRKRDLLDELLGDK